MRKRWHVNKDAVIGVAVAWWFVWLVLAATLKPDDHTPAALWVWLTWWGPYVVPPIALALRALWRWLRSEAGWLIRREWEAVTDDLRERAGK